MTVASVVIAVLSWLVLIVPAARAADVPPEVVAAIVYVESRGQPDVGNADDGIGLMGVRVFDGWGPTEAELLDPPTNIAEGTRRLRLALDATGDVRRALIVYHMGLAGAARAGWEQSEDGAEYLRCIAEAWALLYGGDEPLPWPVKARRAEEAAREP